MTKPTRKPMAEFKPVVLRSCFRRDGLTYLFIKLTHKKKSRYIRTDILASVKHDITPSLRIKNKVFLEHCEDIIRIYRSRCNAAYLNDKNVDEIKDILLKKDPAKMSAKDIDFLMFAREEIKLKENSKNYQTAINRLVEFIGRNELPVSELTYNFLLEFEKHITNHCKSSNNKGMTRAVSLYMTQIKALYNRIQLKYNTDDNGAVLIPFNPFSRYKIPKAIETRKRALPYNIIKKIFELPYSEATNSSGGNRFNLAKDCFLLSFGLIGMNSADLFNAGPIKNNVLEYNRKKTSTRRTDKALIRIQIQPDLDELIEKYKDPAKKHAFNFYKQYSNEQNFNAAINKGLKQIEKVINNDLEQEGSDYRIEDLEFYAARHSWATIAINKLKIDKYIVHEALNHKDETLKVTEIYVEKDFSRINQANRKVLNFVFGTKANRIVSLRAV